MGATISMPTWDRAKARPRSFRSVFPGNMESTPERSTILSRSCMGVFWERRRESQCGDGEKFHEVRRRRSGWAGAWAGGL